MPNPHEITLAAAVAMTEAYQTDSLFTNQTFAVKASNDTYLEICGRRLNAGHCGSRQQRQRHDSRKNYE